MICDLGFTVFSSQFYYRSFLRPSTCVTLSIHHEDVLQPLKAIDALPRDYKRTTTKSVHEEHFKEGIVTVFSSLLPVPSAAQCTPLKMSPEIGKGCLCPRCLLDANSSFGQDFLGVAQPLPSTTIYEKGYAANVRMAITGSNILEYVCACNVTVAYVGLRSTLLTHKEFISQKYIRLFAGNIWPVPGLLLDQNS
ncbi:hypothetical protein Cob_v006674 [Colletotrichum orbiculare MAFF 240422]|uniref:Uncharacterized protein n=1 Tax=Colletotrichum orbiculare (strain 104-T / ATCC 96160 / CBS 514.97 / LARS 414 / MAFF 240422) TaxID=1213857 RepID=A0A484FR87_COLOR|nr:hypothetical protein Cob_v006674 [Colletotrichum orbiculare MAFF 240422]